MNKMIFNVAASESGALSILNEHYEKAKNDTSKYIFVIGTPHLDDTDRIKILRYPWVKKSLIHRLFFDYLIAPRLIKNYPNNQIISLQNTIIPRTKIDQSIYIHNVLAFSNYKISLFREPYLWLQKNVIGKRVIKSLRKAKIIYVQSNWLKKLLIKRFNFINNKVIVDPPTYNKFINTKLYESTVSKYENVKLFYPSTHFSYKNHQILLNLARLIKTTKMEVEINITLNGYENGFIKKIYKIVNNESLKINFLGNLNTNELFKEYISSILVFPSLVENVGLPLLEAKELSAPILAADLNYSREILRNYKKVAFFNPLSIESLFSQMVLFISLYRSDVNSENKHQD